MADSYSRDFFLDSAIEVKQEPSMDGTNFTQSVPIPGRRPQDISDNRDMELFSNFELEICSPGAYQSMGQFSPPVMYNEFNLDVDSNSKFEPFKMDDDDIFQVDKNDLIQGPTLAELNANDDTLLRDLNFDDLVLPEENYSLHIGSSMLNSRATTPQFHVYPPSAPLPSPASYGLQHRVVTPCSPLESYPRSHGAFSPGSGHSSQPSSLHSSQHGSPGVGVGAGSPHLGLLQQELMGHSRSQHGSPGPGLHELLTAAQAPAVSAPTRQHIAAARLSTSAPTHLSLEQIWQRREPRKHLLSTGSLVEAGSTSSLSTGGILSPGAQEDLSQDEDSDEDSDRYEDYSSDDSDAEYGPEGKSRRSLMAKKERFFWQYNVQAKGPKGQRLVMKTKLEDPHVLNEVTDPVFSPSCSVRGIKHSGKARKGDGNDLTPNPRKLYVIGKELDSLGRVINDMTPVSELPFNVRPKTRKEKNKLASRACRLKKKAQHEANKLKLYGLENEHRRLINGISHLKQLISKKLTQPPADPEEHNAHIEKIMKSATKVKIAGQSSEFVNRVLDKVKSGVPGGGLEEF